MWKQSLLAVVLSLCGGAVFGWFAVGKRSHDAWVAQQVAVVPGPVDGESWTVRRFEEALRAREEERKSEAFNPIAKKLSDWTDDELRMNLEASLRDPDFMLRDSVGEGVGTMLLAEWLRRDLSAALAWFDGLSSPAMKGNLADGLMDLWPRNHADEGRAFFAANRQLFPEEEIFPPFIQQSIR